MCQSSLKMAPTGRQDLPCHPAQIMASMSSRTFSCLLAGSTAVSRINWSVPEAFPSLPGCLGSQHYPFPRCCASQPPPQSFPNRWWHCLGWCCPWTFPNPWAFPTPWHCSSFFAFLFQGGIWLFQARRRACSSGACCCSRARGVLGAPCLGPIRGGELFQFLGNSICHPPLAPFSCIFQG